MCSKKSSKISAIEAAQDRIRSSRSDKIDITDRYHENYARAISELIIEQQISFKVAKTIKNKFKILIRDLTDSQIINLENSKIKSFS